jgi:hypothetical protein
MPIAITDSGPSIRQNGNFFKGFRSILKILLYLCTRELTPYRLRKMSERLLGGNTTFGNASLTLCFWLFETYSVYLRP